MQRFNDTDWPASVAVGRNQRVILTFSPDCNPKSAVECWRTLVLDGFNWGFVIFLCRYCQPQCPVHVTESRQGGPWDSEQYPGVDQRPRFSRAPTVDAGCGTRSDGSTAVSASAWYHWALEPGGSHQHFLGRQVCRHTAQLLFSLRADQQEPVGWSSREENWQKF